MTGNREYNPGWHTALDLHNLLTVSEAITRSALARKESRGGHFRSAVTSKMHVGRFVIDRDRANAIQAGENGGGERRRLEHS